MKSQLNIKELIVNCFSGKESWIIFICFGLTVKLMLFNFKLGDYTVAFEPWINFIKNNGYASSLKYNFYDYTPAYIYILIAIAKVGFNPLYSIKIISIFFEFVAAYYVGKIAYLKYKNNIVIWISLGVFPVLPSILLNGAYWGQCDSIYSAFVLGSIYYIFKKKQFLSILFLGIALSFKIQAVFILPFYFVLLLRGNIKWYYFSLIPIVYFITILPAWLYGRPILGLLTIYLFQSGFYEMLTLYFPNVYIWISDDYYTPAKDIGILFTIAFTVFVGFWLKKKKYHFKFETLIELAFLSVLIIPFILPGMHERYLYLGDLIAVLYFLIFPQNIRYSIGITLTSFYSYLCCSRLKEILPLWPGFIVYLLIIILISKGFVSRLKEINNDV